MDVFEKMAPMDRQKARGLMSDVLVDMRGGDIHQAYRGMVRLVGLAAHYGLVKGESAAERAAAGLLARGSLVDDPTPELDAARRRIVALGDPSVVKGLG